METRVRDRILLSQLVLLQHARTAADGVRRRLTHAMQDELGQTPTEYLMIVGLMAAAIVTIFVTFFWGTVRGAASTWSTRVHDAVIGDAMK